MDLYVIFDLDGLLADTEPIWSESARILLQRRGRVWDPSLKPRFMGRHPLEVALLLREHHGLAEPAEDLLQERLCILQELYRKGGIGPKPGAGELVQALHAQRVPMAVASGSPDAIVRLVVERLGMSDLLPVQVGSDQVRRGKPDPEVFLLAAGLLQAPPRLCVVLEDSAAGVEAALAAGMVCIAIPSPETKAEAVARAHGIVASLCDLDPPAIRRVAKEAAARWPRAAPPR